MSKTKSRPPRLLVIGDWVVDDTWVIGNHYSPISSNVGLSHFKSLHDPRSNVRKLSAAGHVATLLHDAEKSKFLQSDVTADGSVHAEGKGFDIVGFGLWHTDDTDYIKALFDPKQMNGRTPFRITSDTVDPANDNDMRSNRSTTDRVTLFNLGVFLDPKNYSAIAKPPFTDSQGHFGTTRVFRVFQNVNDELRQLARVDWELTAQPKLSSPTYSWLTDDDIKRLRSPADTKQMRGLLKNVDAVVVKDIGKGVVSQALLSLLIEHSATNLRTVPWYISTRFINPEWLEFLGKSVPIKLLYFSETAISQASEVPTWVTKKGKISPEAMRLLKARSQHLNLDFRGQSLLVVNTGGFKTIVMDIAKDGVSINEKWFVQPKNNPNKAPLGADMSRNSCIFSAFIYTQICLATKPENHHGIIPTMDILDGSLGVAESYITNAVSQLRAQTSTNRCGGENRLKMTLVGPDPVDLNKNEFYLHMVPFKNNASVPSSKHDMDSEMPTYKDHIENTSDITAASWDEAMKNLGEVTKSSGIKAIQLWRAMIEVDGYICCHPKKRGMLAELRDSIRSFDFRGAKKSVSSLIIAKSGAGKSFLIQKLSESQDDVNLQMFNITTMIRKEEILSTFDQIVTSHLQHPRQKTVVFFDEINASIENHPVYDSFLAPLEDGYYLRNGIKFVIPPCFWIFAGTEKPHGEPDTKASDFISRLTIRPINLASAHVEEIRWQFLENVYLGLSLAKAKFPVLNQVDYSVPKVLSNFRSDVSNRDIKKFIDRHFVVHGARGRWKDKSVIYDSQEYFGFEPKEIKDQTAGLMDDNIDIEIG